MRGDLPNGPGFFYRKNETGNFDWECMLTKSQWSFEAISWLDHLQHQSPFSVDGNFHRIQHALNRGEKQLLVNQRRYNVDGYVEVNGEIYIMEFDGCQYHECHCLTSMKSPFAKKDDQLRNEDLSSLGTLIIKKECDWLEEKASATGGSISRFFREKNITEETILKSVEDGSFFGMICVDIYSPPEVIDYFMKLKHPPVYRHVTVDDEMISKEMLEAMKSAGIKFPFDKQLTLTFHAQEHLITSDVAQFYMKKGLKLSNLKLAVEYNRDKPLLNFVNMVTEKRKEATRLKDDHLQNTYKLVMNSSYGKLGLNKSQFRSYTYEKLDANQMIEGPFILHTSPVVGEFETDYTEVASKKSQYKDSVPG